VRRREMEGGRKGGRKGGREGGREGGRYPIDEGHAMHEVALAAEERGV